MHIVLLHGYGATGQDLASLSEVVTPPKGARFLFPEGPIEVVFGPSYMGRAWFSIDFDRLHEDWSSLSPKGLEEASRHVKMFLKNLSIPLGQVVLGGFSQGAMLATEVALSLEEQIGGLVIFSGILLDQERWRSLAEKKRRLRYFQSHGTHDDLLALEQGVKLHALLSESGLQGEFLPFEGGHTIPEEVLGPFETFLQNL